MNVFHHHKTIYRTLYVAIYNDGYTPNKKKKCTYTYILMCREVNNLINVIKHLTNRVAILIAHYKSLNIKYYMKHTHEWKPHQQHGSQWIMRAFSTESNINILVYLRPLNSACKLCMLNTHCRRHRHQVCKRVTSLFENIPRIESFHRSRLTIYWLWAKHI